MNKPDRPADRVVVTVTYNGADAEIEYNAHASVQSLLDHAMNEFKIHDNRHLMALWTTGGVELPVEGSIGDAGVRPGDLLVLRPSAVRGGTAC